MPILTSPAQPDYVALAMVLVLAVVVAVMALRKYLRLKNAASVTVTEVSEPTPAANAEAPAAPGSAGQVKIYDVEPKVAAMLMCIVADKLGKPLNELRFISIKEEK